MTNENLKNMIMKENIQKNIMFSVEDIANILQLSIITVRGYLRTGKIKGIKIGRAWRVTEEELLKFTQDLSNKQNEKNKEE